MGILSNISLKKVGKTILHTFTVKDLQIYLDCERTTYRFYTIERWYEITNQSCKGHMILNTIAWKKNNKLYPKLNQSSKDNLDKGTQQLEEFPDKHADMSQEETQT